MTYGKENNKWKEEAEIPDFYNIEEEYEGEVIIEVIGNKFENPELRGDN